MAEKLKTLYPRLPILILADGLYPYEDFFAICKANNCDLYD
jgi:serine kinase of HPr protein (carbohydrate metabolism regulator)